MERWWTVSFFSTWKTRQHTSTCETRQTTNTLVRILERIPSLALLCFTLAFPIDRLRPRRLHSTKHVHPRIRLFPTSPGRDLRYLENTVSHALVLFLFLATPVRRHLGSREMQHDLPRTTHHVIFHLGLDLFLGRSRYDPFARAKIAERGAPKQTYRRPARRRIVRTRCARSRRDPRNSHAERWRPWRRGRGGGRQLEGWGMQQRARLAINDDVGGVGSICATSGIISSDGRAARYERNVPVSPRDTRTPTSVLLGPNASWGGETSGDRHSVFSK